MKRKSLQQDQMGCTSRAVGFWGAKVFVLDTHPLCPFGFAMVAFNLWLKWILWWGQISRPIDSGDDDRSRFWQIPPPEDFLRQFWRIRSCSGQQHLQPTSAASGGSRAKWSITASSKQSSSSARGFPTATRPNHLERCQWFSDGEIGTPYIFTIIYIYIYLYVYMYVHLFNSIYISSFILYLLGTMVPFPVHLPLHPSNERSVYLRALIAERTQDSGSTSLESTQQKWLDNQLGFNTIGLDLSAWGSSKTGADPKLLCICVII